MRSPIICSLLLALTIASAASADTMAPAPNVRIVRADPYKNFKFRVVIDGRSVAGFSQVSGLPKATRTGARRSVSPLLLHHGVTRDTAFEKWISAASPAARSAQARDITLVVQDETGHAVRRYNFHHAWVSKYQGVPDLNANANDVAIETLTLEHEGVEIDERDDDR